MKALEDVCQWLNEGGEVAVSIKQSGKLTYIKNKNLFQVFDATNSSRDRREMIYDIVVKKMGYKLFFVESICDDPIIIEQNIKVCKIYYNF